MASDQQENSKENELKEGELFEEELVENLEQEETIPVLPPEDDDEWETGSMIVAMEAKKKKNSVLATTGRLIRAKILKSKDLWQRRSKPKKQKKKKVVVEKPKIEQVQEVKENKVQTQKKPTPPGKYHPLVTTGRYERREKSKTSALTQRRRKHLTETKRIQKGETRRIRKVAKEALTKIQDRKLHPHVARYIRAGFWTMLHNKDMENRRSTGTFEYPERFLAPDKKGRMRFSGMAEAMRKNGVIFKLAMLKKFPESDTVSVLEAFIEHYSRHENCTFEIIHEKIFIHLCRIFSQKPSHLRPRFKHPYQPRESYTTDEIISVLRKMRKKIELKENSEDKCYIIDNFISKYSFPGQKNVSAKKIKPTDITPLKEVLSNRYLERFFHDLRRQASISEALECARDILDSMEKPHYGIRVSAQILSNKDDWISKVTPAQSLGIRNIHGNFDLRELQEDMFDSFYTRYQGKIHDLVTGKLTVDEISKDQAQKRQPGTRTQELEDLIPPLSHLRLILKKRGERYPQIDGALKAFKYFLVFLACHLWTMSGTFLLHGEYCRQLFGKSLSFWQYPLPRFSGFSPGLLFDLMGSFAGILGSLFVFFAIIVGRRYGRKMSILFVFLWTLLCFPIIWYWRLLGYWHILWIFCGCYIFAVFTRPKCAAHFQPEFGKVTAPMSSAGKIVVLLSAFAFIANFIYLSIIFIR